MQNVKSFIMMRNYWRDINIGDIMGCATFVIAAMSMSWSETKWISARLALNQNNFTIKMKNQTLDIMEFLQKFIMGCKGICHRYVAKKPFMKGRYVVGQKRCSSCAIFIHWDGNNCPCCGIMLRTKPKGTEDRRRLLLVR